jgi:hypothetical protein
MITWDGCSRSKNRSQPDYRRAGQAIKPPDLRKQHTLRISFQQISLCLRPVVKGLRRCAHDVNKGAKKCTTQSDRNLRIAYRMYTNRGVQTSVFSSHFVARVFIGIHHANLQEVLNPRTGIDLRCRRKSSSIKRHKPECSNRAFIEVRSEPPRVFRRLVSLSHAASADSSIWR